MGFTKVSDCRTHFKSHFVQSGHFRCTYEGCTVSFDHWRELLRHARKHCIHATRFDCEVQDCERKGATGFVRKDKLDDHLRQKHGYGRARVVAQPSLLPKPAAFGQ